MIRSFHDQNLSAVSICDDTLKLEILGNEQEKTWIAVEGLEKLRISDMEEGNIIANLRIFSIDNYSVFAKKIAACVRYVYKLDDARDIIDHKGNEHVKRQCSLIEHGELIVLEIEPSYGCYLVALGRNARQLS